MSISDKRAADLLCSAFEGGSNYWYNIVNQIEPAVKAKPWGDEYTPSYISIPFSDGGKLIIQDIEGDEDSERYPLDLKAIERGKKLLLTEEYQHHFADICQEQDDADTGDVFLQLCLFGEVIYG